MMVDEKERLKDSRPFSRPRVTTISLAYVLCWFLQPTYFFTGAALVAGAVTGAVAIAFFTLPTWRCFFSFVAVVAVPAAGAVAAVCAAKALPANIKAVITVVVKVFIHFPFLQSLL